MCIVQHGPTYFYWILLICNLSECYVGGLPKEKNLPFQYKAPFSLIDVIEEYTRPARLFENQKIIIKEPLTDLEIIELGLQVQFILTAATSTMP